MARLLRCILLIISVLVLAAPVTFATEQITVTTYYPSPYGSYGELTAYRMKIGTTYAGSGVSVTDSYLIVEGRIGIATPTPGYQLDVNGAVNATSYRVGGTAGFNGTITAANNCVFTPPSTLTCETCTLVFTNGIITSAACT